MGDLHQYIGRRFCDLEVEGMVFVDPKFFGELEVSSEDVARAFPPNLLGLFNQAAVRHHLVSEDVVALMVDVS